MFDVEQTIISQYGATSTIAQLCRNMGTYIDPATDFNTFYDYVWNVETAQGFGLDVWGRIVNIARTLTIPVSGPFLGFNEAATGAYTFADGTFYPGFAAATQTYILSDDAYRKLILFKALSNISSTDCGSLNQLLQNMFSDRGRCYVNDLGNMKMRYTFEFALTPYELAIVTNSGAIPRPAGVNATIIQTDLPVFGFYEAGTYTAAPFGQGTFISESAINAVN